MTGRLITRPHLSRTPFPGGFLMFLRRMRPRCALGCGVAAVLALLGGCGQPVREDRGVNWSPQGNQVGFQHGADGVFVADKEGGGLKKVFTPAPDVIATSTPLWDTEGRRL